MIGEFHSSGEWIHPKRIINSFEIILVLEGTVYIAEEAREYTLQKNQLLVLEPYKEHYGYKKTSKPVSFYWFHFSTDFEVPLKSYTKADIYEIKQLLKKLLHITNSSGYSPYAADSAGFLVYEELKQLSLEEKSSNQALAVQIEEYIRNNIKSDITISNIARHFGYNPDYIGKYFKKSRSITEDYDVRRAAMFLKLLRFSYSSSGKSYASQPFDLRKLFGLISELQTRMANVIVENQDFETLIKHYDRPDAFFYADPPYFSTEDMYEVGFGWDDHVRLRDTLKNIKGKFLLSYNDCPEIRELYEGFSLFDFSRTHSMAQRYEAGKEFKELLIGNYDLYERERAKPAQLTLFNVYGDAFDDECYDYEKILKECIIQCKIRR